MDIQYHAPHAFSVFSFRPFLLTAQMKGLLDADGDGNE